MKLKSFLFLLIAFFIANNLFSKNITVKTASLENFIYTNIFEPVSEAKILIEISTDKKGSCITGSDGKFGINFSNIDEIQGKENKKIKLKLTIIPPSKFSYKSVNNVFFITIDKNEGSYFEYYLKFERENTNSINGKFIIERNTNVSYLPPPKGPKQGKGSGIKKYGDSYQGEVMHF